MAFLLKLLANWNENIDRVSSVVSTFIAAPSPGSNYQLSCWLLRYTISWAKENITFVYHDITILFKRNDSLILHQIDKNKVFIGHLKGWTILLSSLINFPQLKNDIGVAGSPHALNQNEKIFVLLKVVCTELFRVNQYLQGVRLYRIIRTILLRQQSSATSQNINC